MTEWAAPVARGPLSSVVTVPGSKSETNRALVLAALADGISSISGGLRARDADLMTDGLRALGVGIDTEHPDRWVVVPPDRLRSPEGPIDCGLAGTVMRFLPAVAALTGGTARFIGDERASDRPVTPLLDGLRQLGVEIDVNAVPFTMVAPEHLGGPEVTIDSSGSSQFISALLLVGARLPHGLTLRHSGGEVPSRPHIDMTCEWLSARGVSVTQPDDVTWRVEPGRIKAIQTHIAPDLTNAAAFLAAGVLSGGSVTVRDWPAETTQGGAHIIDILRRMGAHVEVTAEGCTATSTGRLRGIDVDLRATSELTPVVAGLAAFAEGMTTITGVGHIRTHETDRLAGIDAHLGVVGVPRKTTDDGLIIMGGHPSALRPGYLPTLEDHRMAHLAALLGLMIDGVILDDVSVTSKTMPDFPQRWAAMVGGVQ